MNFLITGGSGFLGKNLTQFLLESGHRVTTISSSSPFFSSKSFTHIQFDLSNENNIHHLTDLLSSSDHCIFLAAKKPVGNVDYTFEINQKIDFLCAKAFSLSDCNSCVYLSGLSLFTKPFELVNEFTDPSPDTPYTSSKLYGENLFLNIANSIGKMSRILRIQAPYGPGMPEHAVVYRFLNLAQHNQPITIFGDGDRIQQFTWVGDCSEAIFRISNKPTGIFHFSGPDRISMNDLALECIKVTASSSTIIHTQEDPGVSCPFFDFDAFEVEWPRNKRTNLHHGLHLMCKAPVV